MKTNYNFLIFVFSLVLFLAFVSAEELQVTQEHPFLVNGSWISASDLKVGDILTTADGKKVRITNLEDIVSGDNFSVYNLEAGEYSNFVVGEDGVVVHNSDVAQTPNAISKNPLTKQELVDLLTKPGGSRVAGEIQADDAINFMDYTSKSAQDNFLISVRSHLKTTEKLGPDPAEMIIYQKVMHSLTDGDGLAVYATTTDFFPTGRFSEAYRLADENFFSGFNVGGGHIISRSYKIPSEIVGGAMKEIRVTYRLRKTGANRIQFEALGGVESGGRSNLRDLFILLEDFRVKAITAPTMAERARAIAEFEWVHSVSTPSVFGGGTVVMQSDYRLLEAAGFRIPHRTYRRIELEAISTPVDGFLNNRVQELMRDYLFWICFLKFF